MAHVGVERLGARHREKNAAEHDETHGAMGHHEADPRNGAQRLQDLPGGGDMDEAQHSIHQEERHHDRAEEGGDAGGAATLCGEQQHENDHRRRQDVRRQIGVDLLQPLERGENRDRRGDDRIAGKQRGPGHAEQKGDGRGLSERPLGEGHQGENAALTLVVRLHQKHHVFRGDDDQQGPDDERDDADDLSRPKPGILELAERGLKGVKRARPNIPEHDPDRAQRQDPEIAARMAMGLPGRMLG